VRVKDVRFEVVTVLLLKIQVFWDVILCGKVVRIVSDDHRADKSNPPKSKWHLCSSALLHSL